MAINPVFPEASKHFRKYDIYNGIMLESGHFGIATLGGGFCILGEDGSLIQKIDKKSGLNSERIYGVYTDKEGAIWLATDNGITHAEVESPISNFGRSFWVKRHRL